MKTSRQMHSFICALGGLILLFLFQNMSLIEFNSLNIEPVDEGVRREQARELLGAYYHGSSAQKLEGQEYLNYLVYKKIDESIGAKWKSQVPQLVQTLISECQSQEFDPVFILAVIQTESGFNSNARGSAGEIGLMQILPRTAEWIAKKYHMKWSGDESLTNPVINVRIGIRYFAHLRNDFDHVAYHYLPAYNMGAANMRRLDRNVGSVDTDGNVQKRDYAMRVMKNYFLIYQEMAIEQKNLEQTAKAEETDTDTAAE